MWRANPILILFVVLLWGCGNLLQPITGGGKKPDPTYQEDLSMHRLSYELEARSLEDTTSVEDLDPIDSLQHMYPVNDTVNAVLDSISAYRLQQNRVSGYTILVYSSMSREEARLALGRLYKAAPEVNARLEFQQPFFRVKAGKFMHEYHVYELFNTVTKEFPNAVIIPETYPIIETDDN